MQRLLGVHKKKITGKSFWQCIKINFLIFLFCFIIISFIFSSYAVDLVVCCALGVDMFDCVYPTRTAVSRVNILYSQA